MKYLNSNCQRLLIFRQTWSRSSSAAMIYCEMVSLREHLRRISTPLWKPLRIWVQFPCCSNFMTQQQSCQCHDFSNVFAIAGLMRSIESPVKWRGDLDRYFLKPEPCRRFTPEKNGMSIGCIRAETVINSSPIPLRIFFVIVALRLASWTSLLEITEAVKIPSSGW